VVSRHWHKPKVKVAGGALNQHGNTVSEKLRPKANIGECTMGKSVKNRTGLLRMALLCGSAVALMSCSNVTPPLDAISTADMAVNRAIDAKSAQLAPLDLRLAREKLDLAKTQMGKQDYVHARWLAEEARVDGRVAEARAKAQTASDNTREVQQTMQRLHHDVEQKATDLKSNGGDNNGQ
jgi:hypothetical protein